MQFLKQKAKKKNFQIHMEKVPKETEKQTWMHESIK